MCGVGVHPCMPHRRNLDLGRANRKIETLKSLRRSLILPLTIAKTRTRHKRDQIGVARDLHRIRKSRHDNRYSPPQSKFFEGIVNWSGKILLS